MIYITDLTEQEDMTGKEMRAVRGGWSRMYTYTSTEFPTTSLSPAPPGVPIPYPNTGAGSDTSKGRKKVKTTGYSHWA